MKTVLEVFGDVHRSIDLARDGRFGGRLAWIPMLLRSTRGRRTGLIRAMDRPEASRERLHDDLPNLP